MVGTKAKSDASEWWFYHLEHGLIEEALGPLLEKCLQKGWKVLVMSDPQRIADLDTSLWNWRDDSFIPHGTIDHLPEKQPVLISSEPKPINGADVLVLLDGSTTELHSFKRIIVLFHENDNGAKKTARQQFRDAKKTGGDVKYFQQKDGGGWSQKA